MCGSMGRWCVSEKLNAVFIFTLSWQLSQYHVADHMLQFWHLCDVILQFDSSVVHRIWSWTRWCFAWVIARMLQVHHQVQSLYQTVTSFPCCRHQHLCMATRRLTLGHHRPLWFRKHPRTMNSLCRRTLICRLCWKVIDECI